jgi:hypothetical protein
MVIQVDERQHRQCRFCEGPHARHGRDEAVAPAGQRLDIARSLRIVTKHTADAVHAVVHANVVVDKRRFAPEERPDLLARDGNGDVTGWAAINAGGLRLTADFVNSRFSAPLGDCSIPISLSMSIREFAEATMGPYAYIGVASGDGSAMNIDFMMLGSGPGTHVELDHARRISMKFD